jgi:adenosylhomocysteine nucleosidase
MVPNLLSPASALRALGALLLSALLGIAVVPASAAPAPLYAVCGAYPPEMDALRREFGADGASWTRSTINGVTFWRGEYRGRQLVLFRTGVSMVNAAYQLQLALERFPITHILFAGVAGGIDPALSVGDVVIPERWAYHGEAAYLNEDGQGGHVVPDYLKPKYENFGMIFPDDVAAAREGEEEFRELPAFPADPVLLEAARRALPKIPPMRKLGRPVEVSVGGTGVAGTVFLDNARYREWVFRVWRARCLDMESTALAHVAWANRRPILILRGLSDLAGAQKGKNPIDANEARVSEIAARVLRHVLDEL